MRSNPLETCIYTSRPYTPTGLDLSESTTCIYVIVRKQINSDMFRGLFECYAYNFSSSYWKWYVISLDVPQDHTCDFSRSNWI